MSILVGQSDIRVILVKEPYYLHQSWTKRCPPILHIKFSSLITACEPLKTDYNVYSLEGAFKSLKKNPDDVPALGSVHVQLPLGNVSHVWTIGNSLHFTLWCTVTFSCTPHFLQAAGTLLSLHYPGGTGGTKYPGGTVWHSPVPVHRLSAFLCRWLVSNPNPNPSPNHRPYCNQLRC